MQEIATREDLTTLSAHNHQTIFHLSTITSKLQTVSSKNEHLHNELAKYKLEYKNFLQNFHSREESLQKLLEMKDSQLETTTNDLRVVKTESQNFIQKLLCAKENFSLLNNFKKLPKIEKCAERAQEFYEVLEGFNEIGQFWRDTDSVQFGKSLKEIKELVGEIERVKEEMVKVKLASADVVLKNQVLADQIQELENEENEFWEIQAKLEALHPETVKSTLLKETLNKDLTELQITIEKIKTEKENLASKLEEIYEKLVNERMNSQTLLEDFSTRRHECEKIHEKINQEKILKNRLTEQLDYEKSARIIISNEISKTNDLDTLLSSSLADLNASGVIEKQEDSYFHNGKPISLTVHHENFIVVQEKTGPIPLSDFLLTAANHLKPKKENTRPETEKSKSPLRGVLTPKPSKTPLKDRLSKKPFK